MNPSQDNINTQSNDDAASVLGRPLVGSIRQSLEINLLTEEHDNNIILEEA